MGHKVITEAIIENGKLKYVGKKLPDGRITVHIIYDAGEETLSDEELKAVMKLNADLRF